MTRRKTTEEFIEDAKTIHGDKYDYRKTEYINTHTKVCIVCPKHGEFWQEPNTHLHGADCPKCSDEKISLKNAKTTEEFIKEAKEIHGDKYDYSKTVYKNSKTLIKFICPEHGEIEQNPKSHLNIGCPLCSIREKRGEDAHLRYYWTIDKCREIALTCETKIQFREHYAAYNAAQKHGWLKEFTWLKNSDNTYWTYERTFSEAQKFDSYTRFREESNGYSIALRKGWLKDYTWLKRDQKPNGYWHDKNNCIQASQTCESRGEFARKYGSAYMVSLKKGWLDDFVWLKDERFDLINDKIDCVYAYEFQEQHAVYVGRTLERLKEKRDRDHLFNSKDAVYIFAHENYIAVPMPKYLEQGLTIKEGTEKEGEWVEKYREAGWKILNRCKTGSIGRIGHRHSRFTREVCLELAKGCINRSEFKEKSRQAYNIARREGWIEEYTWFGDKGETISKKKREFTYDICYQEAQKYDTLKAFAESSPSFYEASRRYGYIKNFTWLKRLWTAKWNEETCYSTAKLYRDITAFHKAYPHCYEVARKNGWLSQYVWLKNNKFVDKSIRIDVDENSSDTPIDSQPIQ